MKTIDLKLIDEFLYKNYNLGSILHKDCLIVFDILNTQVDKFEIKNKTTEDLIEEIKRSKNIHKWKTIYQKYFITKTRYQ